MPSLDIEIFPNTGHHYFFLPLIPQQDGREQQVRRLHPDISFVEHSAELNDALLQRCDQTDWSTSGEHPWLRTRYGSKVYPSLQLGNFVALGIWVAIESNLGTSDRGYVFDRISNPTEDDEGWQKFKQGDRRKTPYFSSGADRIGAPTCSMTLNDELLKDVLTGENSEIKLNIEWLTPIGPMPVFVDLIVDFGNSRTVVLALEQLGESNGQLSSICRQIRFLPPAHDYDKRPQLADDLDDTIVDSWFVLQEPTFSSFGPPRFCVNEYRTETKKKRSLFSTKESRELSEIIRRIPHMFAELSPALMGPAASVALRKLDTEKGGRAFLSSPKRYTWDTEKSGVAGETSWTMETHYWSEHGQGSGLTPLRGEVLRFMPEDGRSWELDNPPTEWTDAGRPAANPEFTLHSRADALTWTGLAVLEMAHRQINTAAWREGNQKQLPRRLRNVLLTYPSGWTDQEISSYRDKWQKALNIFAVSRIADVHAVEQGGEVPTLVMDLDEAVASQLPIVFSEIHRLGDFGENWIELVGRPSAGGHKARVMTVDIGGGTTDTSVVEYEDLMPDGGVYLNCALLFKDSTTTAGDNLAKAIIESVLLPKLSQAISDRGNRAKFKNLFSAPSGSQSEKTKWATITRLVFVPLVQKWLTDIANEKEANPDTKQYWTAAEAGCAQEQIRALNDFVINAGLAADDILSEFEPFQVSYEDIKKVIEEWFEPIARSHVKYVAAFDCDLVIVSGKPSELPQVQDLLAKHLPLLPSRLISSKGYPAGPWFPMTQDGSIPDGKLVTAVGAALYQAIRTGRINEWKIERKDAPQMRLRNYWGKMPVRNRSGFSSVYLEPDEGASQAKKCVMMTNTFIGKSIVQDNVVPEQMYVFRWSDPRRRSGEIGANQERLNVWLRRRTPSMESEAESLEITRVEGTFNNEPVNVEDVELALCTMREAGEHWLDTGRFEVREEEVA